jgi:succinate dehydrogenase / fumarate reductase flavoprotein subunit
MAATNQRVIIIGGGLAGLAAAVRIAEEGIPIDLFSMVPVKRSHSVCAQGGINACNDVARQQGYSEWLHMDETLYGGDFLNDQPPVYEMAYWAPRVIDLMDRMGVPFNRTAEGRRDLRLFGGSLFKRTHFAGATTGQQLLYALDEQTRRWESAGLVTKYEFWEFLWPIIDESGTCRGIVAQDMRTMELRSFRADAVVIATGGCGLVFGKSTNSVICNGAAAARCYRAGAHLGNPEFIQVHPTAIPGEDKCRLMSESARGEGGRVWVPRKPGDDRHPSRIPEAERWYFLEEKYPRYGNLVPRDIATREIFFVCQGGNGIGGGRMVYLDCTHLPEETKHKLAGIFEIYEKFTGDDPRDTAMRIFPAVHYSMGGLWTTFTPKDDSRGLVSGGTNNMMTNIPGLYAFGEVNFQYHGATRLGANALLNCIFDGIFCGPSVANYLVERREAGDTTGQLPDGLFSGAVEKERRKIEHLLQDDGGENPFLIHQEMGEWMTDYCTVIRTEDDMRKLHDRLGTWKERYQKVSLSDTGMWTNQTLSFTRALDDMIRYAEAVVVGAIARKESRGSHYRPDYPDRDDEQFLKTTVARYDVENDCPVLSYAPVTMGLVEPRARTYGAVEKSNEPAEVASSDQSS